MTLRRVDGRFLLPRAPKTAVVIGDLPEWRQGLESAGVHVPAVGKTNDGAPDLVVARSVDARDALGVGADMAIVEGKIRAGVLQATEYQTCRVLGRPRLDSPDVLIPLHQAKAASYAVQQWGAVDRPWMRLRTQVAASLLARRLLPPIGDVLTLAARQLGQPYVVAAASALGVPKDVSWFLTLGQGDTLSRNVFHLFPPGSSAPSWVVKFSRIVGFDRQFERDANGLDLAAHAGDVVAAHAPRLLGRFDVAGISASVETAAPGRRLRDLLIAQASRSSKVALVEAVVQWIIATGDRTRDAPGTLLAERRRLADEVVPEWKDFEIEPALVEGLPEIPAVLQHNDLGSWNVMVGKRQLTIIDWEDARQHGFPLWDLFYFLADALAVVDGASDEDRPAHTLRLFCGELPSSAILFASTRRAVAATGVPEEAVGAVAALCWLDLGLAHDVRRAELSRVAPGGETRIFAAERTAHGWLQDPRLRFHWDAWRGARS